MVFWCVMEFSILAMITIQELSRVKMFRKIITFPSLTEIFILVSIVVFGFLSVLVGNSPITWYHSCLHFYFHFLDLSY